MSGSPPLSLAVQLTLVFVATVDGEQLTLSITGLVNGGAVTVTLNEIVVEAPSASVAVARIVVLPSLWPSMFRRVDSSVPMIRGLVNCAVLLGILASTTLLSSDATVTSIDSGEPSGSEQRKRTDPWRPSTIGGTPDMDRHWGG